MRTDWHDEVVAFRSFADAPENVPLNICSTANRYIATNISIFHDTARCQFLPTTSHLWQPLQPRNMYWLWSIDLACEITRYQAHCLLLLEAHEGQVPPTKIAEKRRNLAANRGLAWPPKGAMTNLLYSNKFSLERRRIVSKEGRS